MIPFNLMCIVVCVHIAAFNDHILKKFETDLLTPPAGSGIEGVGVCVQNNCYHVPAFVIPFNLICNMAII